MSFFSFFKQLILFIFIFIGFHFTYNFFKASISKKPEIDKTAKYKDILDEINGLLEKKTTSHPPVETPPSVPPPSLETDLTTFMMEMEKTIIETPPDNTNPSGTTPITAID
jgi:hypothetical protein